MTDPASLARSSDPSAASVARSEPAALTRSKVVGVRLTPAEYEAMAARAADLRTSVPEVLRLSWEYVLHIERLENSHV